MGTILAFCLAAVLSACLVCSGAQAQSPLGQSDGEFDVLQPLGEGQSFLISTQSDIDGAFALILPSISPDFVPLFWASGTLAGESRALSIPVDSSMSQVVFSISVDSAKRLPSTSIRRPSGKLVSRGDPGVQINSFASGAIVIVDAPEAGSWQLRFGGIGTFDAQVLGNTSLQITRFDFVTLTGRLGHEGFGPIAGQPIIGSEQTGLAVLVGPFATADFRLIDTMGNFIQSLALTQTHPNAAADEFVGSLMLPSKPFRVEVRGKNNVGEAYQRVFPSSFRAQPVEVNIGDIIPDLFAGKTRSINFTVLNAGNPDAFNMVVADSGGFVSSVQPTVISLDGGAMGTVNADISVPPGTPEGTIIAITATATSIANPNVTNGTTLNLAVSPALIE
jgi:hypothetical protein